MTRHRIRHPRRWGPSPTSRATWLTLALVATACGPDEGSPPNDVAPAPEQRSELSRPLDPVRAVEDDPELGSSFADMLDHATTAAELVSGGGYECSIDHYMVDGFVVAVDELCPGYYRRAMLFGDGPQGPESLRYVYGDFDVDGRIDGWFDPRRGFALEDVDRDGVADRSRTTAGHIDPALVDDFADGWSPPEVVEEHVVEDTDHDGWYDLETLVAGQTPEGESTYWTKE